MSLSLFPALPTTPRDHANATKFRTTHAPSTPNLRERDRNVVLFDFGKIRFIIKQFWKDTTKNVQNNEFFTYDSGSEGFDFRRFTDTNNNTHNDEGERKRACSCSLFSTPKLLWTTTTSLFLKAFAVFSSTKSARLKRELM